MAKAKSNVAHIEMLGASAELVAVGDLVSYARKVRKHPEAQLKLLARSLEQFGFVVPVVACKQTREIVSGEARLIVAADMGLDKIPVIWADDWSAAKKSAFRLADNKIGEHATWSIDEVLAELRDIIDDGTIDAGITGFDVDAMLAELDVNEGNGEPDAEAPPLPVVPVSAPGDVWIMGRHRLMCGSSTSADDVARALNGASPHLCVTDQPYGVEYDPNRLNENTAVKRFGKSKSLGIVRNDDVADWREAWALFPGDVVYTWFASLKVRETLAGLEACDFEFKSLIIWAKPHFTLGRAAYHWQHEPCAYMVRKGATAGWEGDRKQTTVWEIGNQTHQGRASLGAEDESTGHSTQKPVECMRRAIENSSRPGDAVYEPFNGSGSTIIACEMTARDCIAIEIDPAHVDVAVQRWQTFSGKVATLEADGRTFDELSAERVGAGVSFPRDPVTIEGGADTA